MIEIILIFVQGWQSWGFKLRLPCYNVHQQQNILDYNMPSKSYCHQKNLNFIDLPGSEGRWR
jgi:hypothetical protein